MVNASLVSPDIESGSEILGILDRARLKVSVVLWVYFPDYEDWRLVLSARQFDLLGQRKAYRLLHDSLDSAGFTIERTPPVMILPMTDSFIKMLRRSFGKAKSVEGMRLGGQMIGDRFIEDAYVYRIS
jgi:hypothetical protein